MKYLWCIWKFLKGENQTQTVVDGIQDGWDDPSYCHHVGLHGFDFTKTKVTWIDLLQFLKHIWTC